MLLANTRPESARQLDVVRPKKWLKLWVRQNGSSSNPYSYPPPLAGTCFGGKNSPHKVNAGRLTTFDHPQRSQLSH